MQSNFNTTASISLALTLGIVGTNTEALAWERHVVVNGMSMNDEQLAYLESVHCERIPDGNYFLTQAANGAWVWGYAALPGVPQGYLGANCQGSQAQRGTTYGSRQSGGIEWSDEYSRTYGGGIPTGGGTHEYFDGATGSYTYE